MNHPTGVVLVSHLNTCAVAPSPSCPVLPGSAGDRAAREDQWARTSTGEQFSPQSSQVWLIVVKLLALLTFTLFWPLKY